MRRAAWILPVLFLAGCGKKSGGAGRLDMGWTGADTGRLAMPATAHWCPADTVLVLQGIEADSGAAIAIFPADSVTPGVYPVGAPGQGLARPRAGVALRRFGVNLVLGYYSLSGAVTVDSGSPLHGSFEATLKGVNTGEQVNVTGGFRGLVAAPGGPTCQSPITDTTTDTVVR
ncbi:MAG: hypothetical protein ABI836_14960 [Gemmatimonadota bacterium]